MKMLLEHQFKKGSYIFSLELFSFWDHLRDTRFEYREVLHSECHFKKLFCLMKLKVMPFAITWAENWPLLTKQVQIYYLSTTKWVLKYWTDSSPMEPRFGWRLWPQFWQMKRLGWWDHSVVEKGTTFPYYSSTKRVRPEWNCHSMTFHTFAWQILWHQGFSLHFFCGGND